MVRRLFYGKSHVVQDVAFFLAVAFSGIGFMGRVQSCRMVPRPDACHRNLWFPIALGMVCFTTLLYVCSALCLSFAGSCRSRCPRFPAWGLIHIVVCRDASGCFVVYLGLKTAHIPMEAPTEIGASIREKGRSGKYFIYSVRVLAFSLTTSTASTVLASSSETSPAASLASSCSTISACIFSLIFTLKVNTSRLSTIRTSGA